MSEPVLSPSDHNEKRIRELELKVAALEAGNALDNATVRDAGISFRTADGPATLAVGKNSQGGYALSALEPNGHILVLAGDLEDDHVGIAAYDNVTGGQRFRVDERGIIDPWFVGSVRDVDEHKSITSGTFVDTHEALFPSLESQGLGLIVPIATGAGTTGEIRWRNGAGVYTDTITIPAAASQIIAFRWLHQLPLGSIHALFRLEVRRASGANNVDVYMPTAYLRSPEGCTILG